MSDTVTSDNLGESESSDIPPNAQGKGMQFVKDVGGKFIVALLIGVAGFLWGTAVEKGGAMNQINTNTIAIAEIRKDVRELQALKYEIEGLRGDIKVLKALLENKTFGLR